MGGGGGKTDHGYLELYFTRESNLEEGKIWFHKRQVFHFIFLSAFYLPLFNSATKNYS
jgi:hypothetical protein